MTAGSQTTTASAVPARAVPRWVRGTLALAVCASFFTVSAAVGVLALPLLLVRSERLRRRRRRLLNLGLERFARMLRALGLVDFRLPVLPEALEGRSFLLVANHPTFLDVVLLLGAIPQATCVVKASWYRSPVLGPMLRLADYIPGPGLGGDEALEAPVLGRIEGKLREGIPVLVFPEGTRSPWNGVHRFRRGAFEAAGRAGVPVQPVLVTVDRPFLGKGQRPWNVPDERPRYRFDWLEPIPVAQVTETSSRALARELRERFRAHLRDEEVTCASD